LEATKPDAAEQEANEWLTAHADEIAKKMNEVGGTGYEATIIPRTLNDPNADIFENPVSKLRQFRKRKAVWVRKADHSSPDGYFLEVGWIGVFGPENPNTEEEHDDTYKIDDRRLHDAQIAATKYLNSQKAKIKDLFKRYKSNSYSVALHSNDTDQLVSTLNVKAGEEHKWSPKVGNATVSETGYTLYLDVESSYDDNSGWDATKRLAKTAADVALWAVS
jgi:hypothetical protein